MYLAQIEQHVRLRRDGNFGVFCVGSFLAAITDGITVAKRTCIFCGGSPLTGEHALPEWLEKVPTKFGEAKRVRHTYQSRFGSGPRREYDSNKLYTQEFKCVCAKCNNEWMNDNENAGRLFIGPMVSGSTVRLNLVAQVAVATWASLRATVSYYGQKHNQPFDDTWLDALYRDRQPPPSWFVWAAAYDGDYATKFETSEIGYALPPPSGKARGIEYDHGVVVSILIGHLALKVLGFNFGPTTEPGPESAIRIWPPERPVTLWPPPHIITDKNIDGFLDWGMHGAEEAPPDSTGE